MFEGSVQERQAIGTSVLTVTAIDTDSGVNAAVSYSTNHSLFNIHRQTGELSTTAELDFETQGDVIDVVIFAFDEGEPSLTSTAQALVTILDVDDAPPIFPQTVYFVTALEEQMNLPLLQLNASDVDSGPDNPLIYALVEGPQEFRVSSTGLLSVVQPLDRESVPQYTLTVSASSLDFTGSTLSATATVVVQVLDANDNPPEFTGLPYQFSISEGASENVLIGTISATDQDIGQNANVSGFVIIGGDSEGIFNLDPQSGLLRLSLANELDRETVDSYLLQVRVSDGNTPSNLFSTANVAITIIDVNDHPPMFELQEYVTSVRENANIGELIFTAIATDEDQGLNAAITYSLSSLSPFFSINTTTGGVFLINTVDFESQQQHSLTLLATDSGVPPLSGSASLLVNIIDADDLPVIFIPDSFSGEVLENSNSGVSVLRVVAQDLDTVQNNPIIYSLEDNIPFSIDSQSGLIAVNGAIDREIIDNYIFQAFASNLPGISATATVTVAILDVNDIAPVFVNATFQFQASESATIGTELGQVAAADQDIGSAGTVSEYSIQGESEQFSIDSQTGVITLALSLDFEMEQEHVIIVTARDGGNPALIGSAKVRITVLDINDNIPQFAMAQFSTIVSETEPVGAIVFTAQAVDLDSGSNQEIIYSLSNPSRSPFSINPLTGDINITAPLALQNYTLTMIATDNGTPSFADSAILTILVTDTNERPQFDQMMYSVSLAENVEVGTTILQVSASDSDVGGNAAILYFISTQEVFDIESLTGNLILNQILDFETQQLYELIVTATDSGNPPLSATAAVLVTIEDINDNRPIFTQNNFSVNILESLSAGSEVINVIATDQDTGDNAIVLYSLTEQSNIFTINAISGAISTLQQLDFELSQSFTFSVTAQDRGEPPLNNTVGVTVFVLDINDNPPQFDEQIYEVSEFENATIGSVVLAVNASDEDSGQNAAIIYNIMSSTALPFQINLNTGEIVLLDPGLDRETIESYMFSVVASNPFSALFSSTAIVQVNVLDSNELPSFESESFQISLSEASENGLSITTIVAQDNDLGENAQLSYSLQPLSNLIAVDMETGELRVFGELDFETMPVIELVLVATDAGTPPLSAITTVQIALTDVNDNSPFITIAQNQFQYTEESPPITIAENLSIFDSDTGPLQNALLTLTLGPNGVPPPSDFIQLDRGFSESQGLALMASASQINITGLMPAGIFTSIISGLVFGSTADEPLEGVRQVSLQVFDGLFISNVAIISVTVVTINDNPPVLDLNIANEGLDYQTTFVEGELFAFLVAGDAMLSDLDGDLIQSVFINLTNPQDGAQEVLNSISFGAVTVTSTGHTLTLTGPASISEFELILQTITYENRAGEPSETQTPRLVVFTVSDESLVSLPAVTSVLIQSVNDPPSLLLGGTVRDITLTYTETDPNLPLFPANFALFDPDSELISFVNVTIVNFESGIDRFLFSMEATNLTVEVFSGTLLVSGPGPIEEFISVLRNVAYLNTLVVGENIEQLQGGKVLQYSASDGFRTSQIATAFITFSAVNDPPFVDLNGAEEGKDFFTLLTEGISSISIVSNQASITDSDSELLSFLSAHLQATVDTGLESLTVSNSTPNIDVIFDTTTNFLMLTGPAVVSEFQTALHSLKYQHFGVEPTPGLRVVTIITSDGEAMSSPAVSRINIQSVNDPPIVIFDNANTPVPFMEGGPAVALFEVVSVSDPDNQLLAFATVTINNALDSAQEVITSQVGGVNVTTLLAGNSISFTYVLSSSTAANFQSLLRSLTYDNIANEPTPGNRNISLVISDGVDLSTPVIITLDIQTINDNSPVFVNPPTRVEVLESASIGTTIFQPIVIDEDTDSEITFSILDNSAFNISATNGLVTLQRSLDRETTESHSVIITASDGFHTVQLSIEVVVLDVNDLAPVFDRELHTATIDENSLLNTQIIRLLATDGDAGSNAQLVYSISSGNLGGIFAINESSGIVSVVGSLDFEREESYSLTIMAQDMGTPPFTSTAFLIISVTNVNDNAPIFNPDFVSVIFNEATLINTIIYTTMATDEDGEAGLMYNLFAGNDSLFRVNSTSGEVILTSSLDFEESVLHELTIEVSDGEFSDLLQLNVSVRDADDNRPMFELNSFFVNILENASIGSNVLDSPLVVSDEDTGPNAVVQFIIESEYLVNLFDINAINSNTAELILIGRLDRETQNNYVVTVVARNPNNPQQNDTAIVNIQVVDVNDESPVFNSSQYLFTVQEQVILDTLVGTVFATDQDSGLNGNVTYTIVSGDPSATFTISTIGEIRVSGILDREMTSQYTLNVLAQDRGTPPLSTTVSVNILVEDINDNAPQFFDSTISTTLFENSEEGTFIVTLEAADLDAGTNGFIQYSIHPDNASLFLIEQNGSIFSRTPFDFEADPHVLEVIVIAGDEGSPSLTSEARVIVTLLDFNEFTPIFEQNIYNVSILETVAIGTTLIIVSATDQDGGSAGEITYTVSDSIPFAVNSSTGTDEGLLISF